MSGYIPALPTANQTIAQTQAPINTNFTVINTAFGIDHTAMTSSTNQGNHSKVTLITGSDPVAVAQGPIVYSKQVSYPGPITKNEIFFEQASGDGSSIVQLTQMSTGNLTIGKPGKTFLAGGLLMQWNQLSGVASGTTVNFPTAFPNNCFYVGLTTVDGAAANVSDLFVYLDPSFSKTGFKVYCTNRLSKNAINGNFTYLAIGN